MTSPARRWSEDSGGANDAGRIEDIYPGEKKVGTFINMVSHEHAGTGRVIEGRGGGRSRSSSCPAPPLKTTTGFLTRAHAEVLSPGDKGSDKERRR